MVRRFGAPVNAEIVSIDAEIGSTHRAATLDKVLCGCKIAGET
jgi:hypothetical protein